MRAAYDTAASRYAETFSDELSHKPLDCELLTRFAKSVAPQEVICDLGCGPGQTTAFLKACGVSPLGFDLSPRILSEARLRHPEIPFKEADMLALPLADNSVGGALAFYSFVHFSTVELRAALKEIHRVLAPQGRFLTGFHIGERVVRVEDFLNSGADLDFFFHDPATVTAEMKSSGFVNIETIEREPYPNIEYPSRRAYVFARKS